MLTKELFTQLLLNIVRFWPYSDDRINSFAEINSFAALGHKTLGANFDDYVAGRFFSRDWVGDGAGKDSMVSQYDALTMYEVSQQPETGISEITLNIISKLQQSETGVWQRSHSASMDRLMSHGRVILDRMKEAGIYQMSGPDKVICSAPQYADWLVSESHHSEASPKGFVHAYVHNIYDAKWIKNDFEDLGCPDMIGIHLDLLVKFCHAAPGDDFYYPLPSAQKGVTTT